MAATLDSMLDEIAALQHEAPTAAPGRPPRWPMLVLRTPKGWTGPAEVDGVPVEGTWRSHQVPLAEVRTNAAHLAALEEWLRSYRPAELFDADGRPFPETAALAPARAPPTSTWPPTGGSWRSSRSTPARAGWRATC